MRSTNKLTKRYVDSIKPVAKKELLHFDSELRGFGIRVFPTGRRTYFIQYRNQFGRTRRMKIGAHGALTPEQAREEAKKLLGEIAKGVDPSEEHKTSKDKPSFQDLAQQYLTIYAKANKRPKSYKEDKGMLDRVLLDRFGSRKIEEITSHDIQLLHQEFHDKPYTANRIRALLSKMFNLAKQWKWISVNPVEGVSKYQEHKRDRWLNEEEMERFWEVLDKHSYLRTSFAFKLMLLTGARKREVLQATWDQFDLEKGIWTKPSHLTKQNKKEHLPISSNAIQILAQLKENNPSDSNYLFPGRVDGKPIQEVKTFWKTVLKEANIENFRIHDLRHTHASHLVSSGLSLSVVGKLLGHTQASTTQRYAHLADEPLREAAELFGSKVGKRKDK